MTRHYFHMLMLCSVLLFASCTSQGVDETKWKSYSNDPVVEHKVDSVLSLMTLEEKIGQLNQFSGHTNLTGPATEDNFRKYADKGLIGSVFNVFGTEALTKLQKHAIEHSRLNIPMLFAADIIHGYKTTFPIPLAESCSWDVEMMERSARIAAIESSSAGIAWNFAPMIDIARDPRWGRVMEGAGEDVYFASRVAEARVKGFQGIEDYTDLSNPNTMIACAKHFVAYGAAEAGRDYNTVDISDHRLRETYFPPFQAAVDAGVGSFMTAFNEVEGVPATGNKYLYTDVLRNEWDFRGSVVTDYTAIAELINHGYVADLKEAAAKAMDAGIDIDMKSLAYAQHLEALVNEGVISEALVDRAAARVLEMKFLLGLFDDPYLYFDAEREKENVENPKFVAEALENAKRSIVLLKNEHEILPILPQSNRKVALIGPMVKERWSLNGEWAIKGDRNKTVTLFEGLESKYKNTNVRFDYAQGSELSDEKTYIKAALKVANRNDVLLVACGEDYNWSGEAASRTDIRLPEQQRELLKALKKTGKPIVLVLFNGRPLDLSWEDENVDAIVEAWYPGMKAGDAVAAVLSGDYNPSAKLTMTFPRNVGQIPIYYNHKNTGRPYIEGSGADYRSSYRDVANSPLYAFGHGLSYTNFEYSNLQLDKTSFTKGEKIDLTVTISNTGKYDGEEIVQLYIHDKVASITRPVIELKDFQKISLKQGESKKVHFTIDESTINFLGGDKKLICEPGDIEVMVSSSSDRTELSTSIKYY